MTRVEAIDGDITKPNFGISSMDLRSVDVITLFMEEFCRRLADEVNIVFHSAATIKFDDDLTKSVNLNVEAVFSMINICKSMRKLEVNLLFFFLF